MQYLLSRACRPILKRLAQERTLCAFDFDGTLSGIVEHPSRARLRAPTRTSLDRLTRLYPCIVVSGRSRADLLGKLSGLKVAGAIGNHGAEMEPASGRWRNRVRRWKTTLEREMGPLPGLWVENKGLSLAVHYRQSTNKAKARRRIFAATRKLKDVRVFGGKQVVNVVLDQAPQKGDALAAERERLRCNWILYVGDDDNDESAFALQGNVVPVRIGRNQKSRARFYLRRQAEIDELLNLLVRLRQPLAPT